MTLEEKSLEMVASWLESITFPTVVVRFTAVRLTDSKLTHHNFLPETWQDKRQDLNIDIW